MERKDVYKRVDSERAYQQKMWAGTGGTLDNPLEVGEHLLLLSTYLKKAEETWASESKPCINTMDIIRKIAGIAVNAGEQHGFPFREGFETVTKDPTDFGPRKSIYEYLEAERAYQTEKWGDEFDDKNTISDWVSYINNYASKASLINVTNHDSRKNLLKVAALAIAAVETLERNDGFAKRHFDE